MLESVEASGSTVEEAIEAALKALGASREEVEIEILSRGKQGFLGIGGQPVRVRATRKQAAAERPRAPRKPKEYETLREEGAVAVEFLRGLLPLMGFDATVEAAVVSGEVRVDVVGEDVGLLIGKGGQNLEALQTLTVAAVERRLQRRPWVVVDVDGYRRRRRERLAGRASAQRAASGPARAVARGVTGRPSSGAGETARAVPEPEWDEEAWQVGEEPALPEEPFSAAGLTSGETESESQGDFPGGEG